jgi:hypothetical protein
MYMNIMTTMHDTNSPNKNMLLSTIMKTDLIRDEIMYWMTPMDALNLRLTCRDMVPNKDMAKYTSIFKYIIPDRRWLMNKMKEGYTFTIMGSYLTTIMDYNAGSDRAYGVLRNHSPNAWAFRSMPITLIVTKNGRFVPCTDEFMPNHVLLSSNDNKNVTMNLTSPTMEDTTRIVQSDWNGIKIKITFPIVDQTTSETLFIDDKMYEMVPRAAYQKGTRDSNMIRYCHMSQDRCTITKPIGPLLMDTTHMYHEALFGVMTSLPNSRKTGKRVVYVIY